MSNELVAKQMGKIEQVLIAGDLARLTEQERVLYYKSVCDSIGLNPLSKPFDYITLNGKLVLYATKACTEQLRSLKKISLRITDKTNINDVYIVTAEAQNSEGRVDSATGAVNIAGLKGDHLANALMKAETKAKRRVTLSICGLGLLDESELETIPELKGGVHPGQPGPNDGNTEDRYYKIDFGKWKGRTIEQIYRDFGPEQIVSYISFLEQAAQRKGVTLGGSAQKFIQEASDFLAAMENNFVDEIRGEADGELEEVDV